MQPAFLPISIPPLAVPFLQAVFEVPQVPGPIGIDPVAPVPLAPPPLPDESAASNLAVPLPPTLQASLGEVSLAVAA